LISSETEANFWDELEKSLPHVLKTASSYKALVRGKKNRVEAKTNFSIDRQAGLVTVFSNSRQHEAVQKYLHDLEKKVSAQVLIEARIIEVQLDEEFQSGINWTALAKDATAAAANFGSRGASALISSADTGVFTASFDTKDISGILNLVKTFGTTRVLSSPRLTVMNNQTAVLKVARNEVYFLTTAQFPTTLTTNGTSISGTPVFSSTPHTVPVGLVMTVQPAINSQTNRITMTMRPTISRVVRYVSDPSIALNAANASSTSSIESQVPVLAVREMDSVLQLQSGQVAVLGGLMQDSSENQDQGLPFFDTLPVIGNLAKSRSNDGTVSELVILIRATILDEVSPDTADIDLYQTYNKDPRSILFSPQQ
jgi:general secretion pathway protein D